MAAGESRTDFAGEERFFRIRLGEIRRIQEKCGNVSIGEIARRLSRCVLALQLLGKHSMAEVLATGVEVYADDVREPIYQGLVSAGMVPGDATRLLRSEIDERGLRGILDNAFVALEVIIGASDGPADTGEGQAEAKPPIHENPSTSPPFTESEAS